MMEGLLIMLVLFTVFWISMMLPPLKMRWAQGWLIPHQAKQEHCLFKCGTCKPNKEMDR